AQRSSAYHHLLFSFAQRSCLCGLCLFFFFLMLWRPPVSTLFPYTTLFRSHPEFEGVRGGHAQQFPCTKCSLEHPAVLGTALRTRSEEHTSELQSRGHIVCRLLLEKKKYRSPHTALEQDAIHELDCRPIPHV